MLRIFLAHANEDKPAVRELYYKLKQKGYLPWLDEMDLLPGQLWRDEIPDSIKNSDIFIACLSQQSVTKRGYVQREFRLALNKFAESIPGDIYLIPLILSDCKIPNLRQEEYGVSLRDIHWLKYYETGGFERLIQAIEYQKERITNNFAPNFQIKPLVSKTTGANYTDLSNVLRDKKYEEADHKTAKLMLEVAKQENQGWLNVDSIQKFPIEDLQIIDHLWFDNSDGKYGFRVLTKVWKECGSPTNYTDKIGCAQWDQFGDKVGWKEAGSWLYSYSNMSGSIILPFQIFVRGGTRLDGKFWVLFTRLDACQSS